MSGLVFDELSEAGGGASAAAAWAPQRGAVRRADAEVMGRAAREIPHVYVARTLDLSVALRWLADRNDGRSVEERVDPAALLLKATAVALRETPALNGTWETGFRPSSRVHLGVAASSGASGPVAPVLRDADRLGLDDLSRALGDGGDRARTSWLRTTEDVGATVTVAVLGDGGADEVFGVVRPPQVAFVGIGRIVERPWAVDGLLGVRPVVRVTVAADHRIADGHDGSRLLARLAELLDAPASL